VGEKGLGLGSGGWGGVGEWAGVGGGWGGGGGGFFLSIVFFTKRVFGLKGSRGRILESVFVAYNIFRPGPGPGG